jgi:hypothetical protein
VTGHPGGEFFGPSDGEGRQPFVRRPGADTAKVVPELVVAVLAEAESIARHVDASNVAGVSGVATAVVLRGSFDKQYGTALLSGGYRCDKGSVATADHDHVGASWNARLKSDGLWLSSR